MGMWQTHEQSFEEPLSEFCADGSCLSSNEQMRDAQSSLLFPVKQSESPHQKRERVKERTITEPDIRAKYVENFLIVVYKSIRNYFLKSKFFLKVGLVLSRMPLQSILRDLQKVRGENSDAETTLFLGGIVGEVFERCIFHILIINGLFRRRLLWRIK